VSALFGSVIIAPDIPEHAVQARSRPWGVPMVAPSDDLHLETVFGRAFLLQLERGDLECATVFARAFLKQHADRSLAN